MNPTVIEDLLTFENYLKTARTFDVYNLKQFSALLQYP